ncbi:unnamed protein product [Clavelina lepadiformis]|uniref:Nucleolar protein 16 n=1 Tax=Clavelina lepadiformis TaxID=159417 RepID=A0ABP0GAP6_CLALP
MPSSKKNRRRKDFVNTNKKREWRKLKRKQNLRIPCDQIRQSWDSEKTVKQNLAEMGLTVDPNQSMKKPSKPFMPKVIEEEKVEAPFKPEVIKGD